MAHEITVVTVIASDMHESGRGDAVQIERLLIAYQRLNVGLSMIGELPVSDEIKRIKGGHHKTN